MSILQPSRNLLIRMLNASSSLSNISQIHAYAIVNGYKNDNAFLCKLTQRLCDFNAVQAARDVFFSAHHRDLFFYKTLIKGFSENGFPLSSLSLYAHLRTNTDLIPDDYTCAFAVLAASELREPKFGSLLHAHCVVDGFARDLAVGSALVSFYYSFSMADYALKVFDGLPERDSVLWNIVISGLVRNGFLEEAVDVFSKMVSNGKGFNGTSLVSILSAVAEVGDLRVGAGFHCFSVKLGLDLDIYFSPALISMYAKHGEIGSARLLFGEICDPCLVCCNAMIHGFTLNNDTDSSVWIFNRLLASGAEVNPRTVVGLIPVSSPYGHFQLAASIHCFSLKFGILSHRLVSTALVTVYSKLNEMDSARQLFDQTPEKLLPSWNAMISGYTQNGLTEPAILLFGEMLYKFSPNATTITSVLSACAQLGTLSLGKWVHGLVRSQKLENNQYVQTALVNMYAKCGSIMEARRIFDAMTKKSLVTWNAMITGYGLNGNGHEAVKLFNEMHRYGVNPDRVTFLSALYACSHAGLVQLGKEIFKSMTRDHGFKPSLDCFTCMVDILGRAGRLRQAVEFISQMPIEPDIVIWRSLLGASLIHKDTGLAKLVSEKIVELGSGNSENYVLLSNAYRVEGSFLRADSVRNPLRSKKTKKSIGYTLIEIGETTHLFKSGDESHPRAEEIYATLDELIQKIEEAGYRIDTSSALNDFVEEDKELLVKVHSEKLAIAFGLMCTEPGTEIRVIKNLRTCLDCHNAVKLISKVMERVIVVRDCNRFHHFKDGLCSCGDYW